MVYSGCAPKQLSGTGVMAMQLRSKGTSAPFPCGGLRGCDAIQDAAHASLARLCPCWKVGWDCPLRAFFSRKEGRKGVWTSRGTFIRRLCAWRGLGWEASKPASPGPAVAEKSGALSPPPRLVPGAGRVAASLPRVRGALSPRQTPGASTTHQMSCGRRGTPWRLFRGGTWRPPQ